MTSGWDIRRRKALLRSPRDHQKGARRGPLCSELAFLGQGVSAGTGGDPARNSDTNAERRGLPAFALRCQHGRFLSRHTHHLMDSCPSWLPDVASVQMRAQFSRSSSIWPPSLVPIQALSPIAKPSQGANPFKRHSGAQPGNHRVRSPRMR